MSTAIPSASVEAALAQLRSQGHRWVEASAVVQAMIDLDLTAAFRSRATVASALRRDPRRRRQGRRWSTEPLDGPPADSALLPRVERDALDLGLAVDALREEGITDPVIAELRGVLEAVDRERWAPVTDGTIRRRALAAGFALPGSALAGGTDRREPRVLLAVPPESIALALHHLREQHCRPWVTVGEVRAMLQALRLPGCYRHFKAVSEALQGRQVRGTGPHRKYSTAPLGAPPVPPLGPDDPGPDFARAFQLLARDGNYEPTTQDVRRALRRLALGAWLGADTRVIAPKLRAAGYIALPRPAGRGKAMRWARPAEVEPE